MQLTGNLFKNPVSFSCLNESDVETNNLNRLGRFAIDTQIEKGVMTTRLSLRDSPYNKIII